MCMATKRPNRPNKRRIRSPHWLNFQLSRSKSRDNFTQFRRRLLSRSRPIRWRRQARYGQRCGNLLTPLLCTTSHDIEIQMVGIVDVIVVVINVAIGWRWMTWGCLNKKQVCDETWSFFVWVTSPWCYLKRQGSNVKIFYSKCQVCKFHICKINYWQMIYLLPSIQNICSSVFENH